MPEPGPEAPAEEQGVERRYRQLFGRGKGAERIALFSDAVYAIALTLLVLDLRIPEGAPSALAALAAEAPSYLAFALSFAIIGYSWIGHHRRFRYVVGHDTGLLVVNLVMLFFVVSLPFPTSLVSNFAPETAAVVAYAAAVALLEAAELAEWVYLRRRRLLAPEIDDGLYRYIVWAFVPALVVFGGSVLLAVLVDGQVAMISWFAMFVVAPVVGYVVGRRIDRDRRRAGAAAA